MEPLVNVGVIGYGYSGRNFHSYLIGLEKRLNLYAICARDPERRKQAATEHKVVKTFSDVGEMLKDDGIDLVVVATPHDTHAELSVKAMDAGKHVVVEKIMCMNTEEADEMIEASRRNNVMLTVFHNRRWDGDYLTVREILDKGLLGEPYLIEESIMWYAEGVGEGWRGSKERGGGYLYDWGAHLVDHAIQIGKVPVDRIYCYATKLRKEVDIECYIKCLIHFENDLTYGIELCDRARLNRPRWFILGKLGSLTKTGRDPQEGAMNSGDIDAAVEDPRDYPFLRVMRDGVVAEEKMQTIRGDWKQFYKGVADHLIEGRELAVKPEDVRRVVAVCETALKSAEGHRSIACSI